MQLYEVNPGVRGSPDGPTGWDQGLLGGGGAVCLTTVHQRQSGGGGNAENVWAVTSASGK